MSQPLPGKTLCPCNSGRVMSECCDKVKTLADLPGFLSKSAPQLRNASADLPEFLTKSEAQLRITPDDLVQRRHEAERSGLEYQWLLNDPEKLESMQQAKFDLLYDQILRRRGGTGHSESLFEDRWREHIRKCHDIVFYEKMRRDDLKEAEEQLELAEQQRCQHNARVWLGIAAVIIIGVGLLDLLSISWLRPILGGISLGIGGYVAVQVGTRLAATNMEYDGNSAFSFSFLLVLFKADLNVLLLVGGMGYVLGACLAIATGLGQGWFASSGFLMGSVLFFVLALVRLSRRFRSHWQMYLQIAMMFIACAGIGFLLAPNPLE